MKHTKISIENYLPTGKKERSVLLNKYISDGRALGVIIEDILKAELPTLIVEKTVVRTVKKGQKTINFRRSKDIGANRNKFESIEDRIYNRSGKTIVVFTGKTPTIGIVELDGSDLKKILPQGSNGIAKSQDLIDLING